MQSPKGCSCVVGMERSCTLAKIFSAASDLNIRPWKVRSKESERVSACWLARVRELKHYVYSKRQTSKIELFAVCSSLHFVH